MIKSREPHGNRWRPTNTAALEGECLVCLVPRFMITIRWEAPLDMPDKILPKWLSVGAKTCCLM